VRVTFAIIEDALSELIAYINPPTVTLEELDVKDVMLIFVN
jgi:hypothetical protein